MVEIILESGSGVELKIGKPLIASFLTEYIKKTYDSRPWN